MTAEFSFGADVAIHASHFRGKARKLIHHGVHGFGGAQEFAFERPAFDFQSHGLGEIALGHSAQHAGGFGNGVHQIGDQAVDSGDFGRSGAADFADGGALGGFSFLAD